MLPVSIHTPSCLSADRSHRTNFPMFFEKERACAVHDCTGLAERGRGVKDLRVQLELNLKKWMCSWRVPRIYFIVIRVLFELKQFAALGKKHAANQSVRLKRECSEYSPRQRVALWKSMQRCSSMALRLAVRMYSHCFEKLCR